MYLHIFYIMIANTFTNLVTFCNPQCYPHLLYYLKSESKFYVSFVLVKLVSTTINDVYHYMFNLFT